MSKFIEKKRHFVNLTWIADRWGMSIQGVLKHSGKWKTIRYGKAHLVDLDELKEYEDKFKKEIEERMIRRWIADEKLLKRLSTPLPKPK